VLLLQDLPRWRRATDERDYRATIADWVGGRAMSTLGRSPLATLINLIFDRWPGTDPDDFEAWLETTAVGGEEAEDDPLLRTVDALDGVLLAALQESDGEVEEALRRVWNETFARYASVEEECLGRAFIPRGRAVARRFQDSEERRRIYRTNLPPRTAQTLYAAAPGLIEHLRSGEAYWTWGSERRLAYIERAIELVSQVQPFAIAETVGGSTATWRDVLRWWLNRSAAARRPTVAQVGAWHDFIARSFTYRFAWGLAAMTLLSVPANDAPNADVWTDAGIPPAGSWIKELVVIPVQIWHRTKQHA